MSQIEIEFRAIITKGRHGELKKFLAKNAKDFHKPDAARKIARELVDMALAHEK